MLLARAKRFVKRRLGGMAPDRLTPTQEMFCEWNAERLGITIEESRGRYVDSWRAIHNGHGGPEFRAFCVLSHAFFRVFWDDNPREAYGAYRLHGPLHFLRMLSYQEPQWAERDPVVEHLRAQHGGTVVDFGCGLAHASRALALMLHSLGQPVHLELVDIPTERKAFLLWLSDRLDIPTAFTDCTPDVPIPTLSACDLCIATEIFEHLHNPLRYLEAMLAAIKPGGLLLTNVVDQKPEYMHVSPDLAPLRQRLDALGYIEIIPRRLYRKPASPDDC